MEKPKNQPGRPNCFQYRPLEPFLLRTPARPPNLLARRTSCALLGEAHNNETPDLHLRTVDSRRPADDILRRLPTFHDSVGRQGQKMSADSFLTSAPVCRGEVLRKGQQICWVSLMNLTAL